MRKRIFRDCLSLILVAAMIFSISVNAFASNTDNKQTSKVKEISQSLRVRTEDAEVEKPLVSVRVANTSLKEPVISIIVDNSLLQKCPELRIDVSCEGKKDAIYKDVLYIGKEVVNIEGLTIGTKYLITVQGTHDISADNFIGYFLLHEKNDELSVEYKITHETQTIREYNETYIRELNRASDLLQEANDKYGCYNKETALLDGRAAPIGETEELDYAATLLADYATASVRYEAEPNNTMAQADLVYDDDTTYGTIGSSVDVDYYKVQFTSAGNANFWLGDIPSGQDYDFFLYDASGNLLQSSQTTSNQEQIFNFPVTANTWYYMKVIGYNGAYNQSAYYRVRAKNYPTIQSGDGYEPNNTFSSATGISNTATITSANIHDVSDVDYYRFTIPSTSSVSISLSNIPTNCDYDLVLFNSSQVQCAQSSKSGNTSESITYSAVPGTYYIKVYSYSGSSSSNYRLSLSTSIISNPDSYETNDSLSTATYITVPTTLNATVHTTSDIDYYRFTISETKNLVVTLSNIPSGCDYDLELWRSSGMFAMSTNGSNSPENISTTLSAGTYYLKVYSHTGCSNVAYRLSVAASVPVRQWGNYITTTSLSAQASIPSFSQTEIDEAEAIYNTAGYLYVSLASDRLLATQLAGYAMVAGGGALFGYTDAANCMSHFLGNTGSDFTNISIKDMIQTNTSYYQYSRAISEMNEMCSAMEVLASPSSSCKIVEITQRTDNGSAEGNNWAYSIGKYRTWSYFNGARDAGSNYNGTLTYHLEDYYNWDPDNAGFFLGILIHSLWELHYTGWAHNFHISSDTSASISWSMGQRIGSGAVLSFN